MMIKRASTKFDSQLGISVLKQNDQFISLRDIKNLKLRGTLGNPLPVLYELSTQAVMLSKEQKQSQEGKKFIQKTLGSLLEETPLLKKLHLGANLDLILEIASEMKVVTLKQGYDLPLNKSGMYLLVDG